MWSTWDIIHYDFSILSNILIMRVVTPSFESTNAMLDVEGHYRVSEHFLSQNCKEFGRRHWLAPPKQNSWQSYCLTIDLFQCFIFEKNCSQRYVLPKSEMIFKATSLHQEFCFFEHGMLNTKMANLWDWNTVKIAAFMNCKTNTFTIIDSLFLLRIFIILPHSQSQNLQSCKQQQHQKSC